MYIHIIYSTVLSETCVQKKVWDKGRGWLTKGYIWKVQELGKRNKNGRAIDGMIMGRKERVEGEKEEIGRKEDGVITWKICSGRE